MAKRKIPFKSLDTGASYLSIMVTTLNRCDVHGTMDQPSVGAEFDNSEGEFPAMEVCAQCLVELVKSCASY